MVILSSVSLSEIKSLSLSIVSKYSNMLESSNLELGPATVYLKM
jgi:hypothetical protein